MNSSLAKTNFVPFQALENPAKCSLAGM